MWLKKKQKQNRALGRQAQEADFLSLNSISATYQVVDLRNSILPLHASISLFI